MKRQICVRSMVLGAVIMLIGLVVGAIVSPPLIAQRNSVFDTITCREIEVIDKDGNEAIRLYTTKHGGDIRIDSKDGGIAIMGIGEHGGSIFLFGKGKGSADRGTISMLTYEDSASLSLEAPDEGDNLLSGGSILMHTYEDSGNIRMKGEGGRARMYAGIHDGGVVVYDKDGGEAEMRTYEDSGRVRVRGKDGGRIEVLNNQGEDRAVMGVNAYGNGAVSTWDKNGYRQ